MSLSVTRVLLLLLHYKLSQNLVAWDHHLYMLMARNSERTQWGWLVPVLAHLEPRLGMLGGWGWLDSWGLESSESSFTHRPGSWAVVARGSGLPMGVPACGLSLECGIFMASSGQLNFLRGILGSQRKCASKQRSSCITSLSSVRPSSCKSTQIQGEGT